ncbi:MAG: hypothetical protein GY801_24260 [bacterium]|nr:hypothetical protein [bacterium]
MENQHVNTKERTSTEKLSAAGWGLFFVWIGLAWLLNVGNGVGLLGVGIIILGMQAVRKVFHLKPEGFWLVVGGLFVAGSLSELLKVELPLAPVFVIIAGVAVLVSLVKDKLK